MQIRDTVLSEATTETEPKERFLLFKYNKITTDRTMKSCVCGTHGMALLLLLFWCRTSCSQAAAGGGNNNELAATGLSDQVLEQLDDNELYGNNKRAWQSLQSAWGKRSNEPRPLEVDDSIYMTGHFVPLVITDGTNTIDWNTFERLASGNQEQQQQLQRQQQPAQSNEESDDLSAENTIDKRAWKNMNVAWGKRRQAQGWNKFRGAWGKREPTWNNLKGMWGKRDQWQKLHAGWGKRSLAN
ncbi:allatostatins MIP [Drosophila novamexicana]|uniref:allatostatins MIP n=1 Tax=Drosophila novamexicana TaxID=47314 RepID=UPI0011E5FEB0|nr:allatostatins MIP [Drosophila novamexicana]